MDRLQTQIEFRRLELQTEAMGSSPTENREQASKLLGNLIFDGMADAWEQRRGGLSLLPWKDGDGWTNLEEYLNGTDPYTGNDPMQNSSSEITGNLEDKYMNNYWPFQVLSVLALSCYIVGCGEAPRAIETTTPSRAGGAKQHSTEVLPESGVRFSYKAADPAENPVTCQSIPPMDRTAFGPYSYRGAADEFKDVCGFEMPDWVKPGKRRVVRFQT